MKDRFSANSSGYKSFRPTYPPELLKPILDLIPSKEKAWDCATGNGQLLPLLIPHFNSIIATDISENQLQKATAFPNVSYACCSAEDSGLESNSTDLITVAQAIHWFNFDAFYTEVTRILKPHGVLAVLGYGRVQLEGEANHILDWFYREKIGQFWDAERKFIDEEYQTIPFPFEEVSLNKVRTEVQWSLSHFLGYLNTWSAVMLYNERNNTDVVEEVRPLFEACWGTENLTVSLNWLSRVGRIR